MTIGFDWLAIHADGEPGDAGAPGHVARHIERQQVVADVPAAREPSGNRPKRWLQL